MFIRILTSVVAAFVVATIVGAVFEHVGAQLSAVSEVIQQAVPK